MNEVSPGNYSNVKYWRTKWSGDRLSIEPGLAWGSFLLLQVFVSGLGVGLLWIAGHFLGRADRTLLILMCIPIGIAMLGCFLGPLLQVRGERRKGEILVFDRTRGVIKLPREKLALKLDQVIGFRIIEEPAPTRPGTVSMAPRRLRQGQRGAAELQLLYKNPRLDSATILRSYGTGMFRDATAALIKAGIQEVPVAA